MLETNQLSRSFKANAIAPFPTQGPERPFSLKRVLTDIAPGLASWLFGTSAMADASAELALAAVREAQHEILDQLPLGGAMCWPDRRLGTGNRRFIDSFTLSEGCPSE